MHISDFLSLLVYLLTIILGILIDIKPTKKIYRRLYIIWLYIFLCFGYTIGSDWRTYEVEYNSGIPWWKYQTEPISRCLIEYGHMIVKDYWIFVGALKAIYLYTLLKLLRKLTPFYLGTMGMLMPLSVVFVLIDNPLRYMIALIFLNMFVYMLWDIYIGKRKLGSNFLPMIFLLVMSVLCQNTILIAFFILFTVIFYKQISKLSIPIILISYVIVVIATTKLSFINSIKDSFITYLSLVSENTKDYSSYELDDNSAIFLLGHIIKMGLFLLILMGRRTIINKCQNGDIIYSMTVAYFFYDRFMILIPTGFRLVLPLTIFLAIYIVNIIMMQKRLGILLFLYFSMQFGKSLYSSQFLIPYTNSIPYIIAGHMPFNERYYYNIKFYEKRTGIMSEY